MDFKDYCNCNWQNMQLHIITLRCCKGHARINRKLGNSTSCKIVTPDNFSSKVCTRDCAGDSNNCAHFGANRFNGSFSTSRWSITPLWLFTMRLHVLQRTVGLLLSQFCPSVCLSVCLSLCQMHVLWQNEIIVCQYLNTIRNSWLWPRPFHGWFVTVRLGHVMNHDNNTHQIWSA